MIRKLLANNAILIIQSAVSGLIPLLLIPHIVHVIGLGSYGELAVALAWASYGVVVVQYAFQSTGPKRLGQLEPSETPHDIFVEITRAKFILLFGVLASVALAVLVMSSSGTKMPQIILLTLLPIGAAFNSGWFLQAAGRFLWICLTSIIASCTALFIGYALVRENGSFGVIGASLALSAGPMLVGVATFLITNILLKDKPKKKQIKSFIHPLREGWPLFVSQLTSALYTVSGPIVIGYLVSNEAAGAYSIVERIINPLIGVCMLTHVAAYPRLASLYVNQRAAYWILLRFVVTAYLMCSLVVIFSAVLAKPWLLSYLFGGKIPPGINALLGWGLVWFSLGIFGTAFTGYLVVSGKQNQVWPLTIKVLSIAVIIGLPGTYVFGAWAWLGALVLSQTIVLYAAYKAWHTEIILRKE